jgi:hypothetical protein
MDHLIGMCTVIRKTNSYDSHNRVASKMEGGMSLSFSVMKTKIIRRPIIERDR